MHLLDRVDHRFIDPASSLTAAKGKHNKIIWLESQFRSRFVLLHAHELAADRIAGDDLFVLISKRLPCFCKSQEDIVDTSFKEFVGTAGNCVLFMNECRDTHVLCLNNNRSTGVSARAHDKIRPELFQDPSRLHAAPHNAGRCQDIAAQASAEAIRFDQFDPVASGWHDIFFHSDFGADEQDLSVWISPLEFIGNGDCRINMAPCSSAGHDDSHSFTSFRSRFWGGLAYLDMFSMIPAQNMNIRSPFPP